MYHVHLDFLNFIPKYRINYFHNNIIFDLNFKFNLEFPITILYINENIDHLQILFL